MSHHGHLPHRLFQVANRSHTGRFPGLAFGCRITVRAMSEPGETRLGPYRLDRLLGEGGMGSVWEAYDARLDRRVAVKRVHPRLADREGVRSRLQREAWAAARLSHPSIVPIFDVLEADGVDWIVMELVEGPTLATVLETALDAAGEPLQVEQVLRWGAQIAGGLAAAHAAGIIHRDLKTENVMLGAGSRVRILDFGLAKPLEEEDSSLTATGEVRGTARAMSPEQARGTSVDERSDLFSLGVLLYELLGGVSPFRASEPLTSMTRVCTLLQEPLHELRGDVPRELSDLVDRLLEKEPAHRPASAEQVERALQALRGSVTPSGAHPPTATSSFASPASLGTETLAPESHDPESHDPESHAPESHDPEIHGPGTRDSATDTVPSGHLPVSPPRPRSARLAILLVLAVALVAFGIWFSMESEPDLGSVDDPSRAAAREEASSIARGGLALLDDGGVDDAILSFRRALALDPDSALAHAGLARAYWARYRGSGLDPKWLDQAEAVARRAVELDAHLARAQVVVALVAIERGQLDAAREALDTAAILAPGDPEMLRAQGDLARASGDLDAALAAYRRAIERAPTDRELHDSAGSTHFQRAEYSAAEAAFRRALAIDPESAPTLRNLSGALMLQGDTTEAAALLQRSLEIQPTPSAYTNLGVLLYGEGRYARAAEAFRRSIETGSGEHLYLHWANLGDALYWAGERPAAREAYQRARTLLESQREGSEGRTDTAIQLALLYAKLGEAQKARALLANADLAAEDSVSHVLAAIAHERLGDRAEALASMRLALDAGYPASEASREPELEALRNDPAWPLLVVPADGAIRTDPTEEADLRVARRD